MEKYYRVEREKQRRLRNPVTIIVMKWCWKIEAMIRFSEAKCLQTACPHRNAVGCLMKYD